MRPLNLTAKLKDTANASIPELSFQRKAVEDYRSRPKEISQPAESPNESGNDPPSDDIPSTSQAKRTPPSITSANYVEDASTQPEQCILFYSKSAN